MRYSGLAGIVTLILIATGCAASQQHLVDEQHSRLQEQHEEIAQLRQELFDARAELQYHDDAASGVMDRQVRSLRERIHKLEYDLAVARDGLREGEIGETIETLPADVLFAPGSTELTERGRQRLAALAERVQRDYRDRIIRVEGHSDNVPIGPGLRATFPSNWELSAARASTVVRYLQEQHRLEGERLEVAAYGPFRPAETNNTAQGRQANRRVRVAAI